MLHTYSLPRPFLSLNIPLAMQSVYLRNYANSRSMTFSLPKVEWCIPNVYLVLFNMANDLTVKHIAMSSIQMMPQDYEALTMLSKLHQVDYHFVLENIIIQNFELPNYIYHQNHIRSFSSKQPFSIL